MAKKTNKKNNAVSNNKEYKNPVKSKIGKALIVTLCLAMVATIFISLIVLMVKNFQTV